MNQQLQAALRNLQMARGGGGGGNAPLPDTAETVYISSLSLLKMLKHGACGCELVWCLGAPCAAYVDRDV